MKVGQRIKACRKEAGLTLKQLSERVGISVSFLSDIENGRSNPSLERLESMADKLGTSVSWLMGEDGAAGEVSVKYQPGEWIETFNKLMSFPDFREIMDCLKDFPKWNKSDKEELIGYLKAKKFFRERN